MRSQCCDSCESIRSEYTKMVQEYENKNKKLESKYNELR